MTSNYEHPSLILRVSDEDRQRAEDLLKEAYAAGRINEFEFDQRLEQVLTSRTRRDLNASMYGVVPFGAQVAAQVPAVTVNRGSGMAAFAHFSSLFLGFIGPAIFYGLSGQNSYARREAAKAFNFQFVSFLTFWVLVVAVTIIESLGLAIAVGGALWLALTIVGGLKASQGEDWNNPVTKAIPLKILSEK